MELDLTQNYARIFWQVWVVETFSIVGVPNVGTVGIARNETSHMRLFNKIAYSIHKQIINLNTVLIAPNIIVINWLFIYWIKQANFSSNRGISRVVVARNEK